MKQDSAGIWRYVEEFVNEEPILGNMPADGPPPMDVEKHLSPQSEPLQSPPMENSAESERTAPIGSFTGPILFILASFSDVSGTTTEAQWGAFVTASIVDYYSKASHGRVALEPAAESFGTVNNGVVGWVNLGYAHPNTADNTGSANQMLTRNAILAADPYVNFAAYDKNADGYVDANELAIVVVAAGYERSYSSNYGPSVWGHKWSFVSTDVVDGKIVGDYHSGAGGYAQFGELHRSSGSNQHQATMGIMVHELGHLIFGLPDLYDTDSSSSGVGAFCLMSYGSWGRAATDPWSGQTPVLPSAWVRYNRGWVDDIEGSGYVSITAAGAEIANSANTVYRASTNLATEYFLVENRQPQEGYDRGLERWLSSGGLAIWHVDTTQTNNTNDVRRLSDLEEADGVQMGMGLGWTDNLWYSGNAVTFNETSNPNSGLNSGGLSGVSITSISAPNTVMTAILNPAPTTYPLTLAKAGTGTGTVSGGGNYAAGASVALTATAVAGSTFDGWSPSPCAPSFAMPANELTCTATFSGTASKATLRISDVSKTEGNAGTTNANFVVTLSPASTGTVTVKYATANGTARTGNRDYTATSGKLTFTPGQIRKTVAVKVIGDTVKEADETFVVNLSAPTGATLADNQGIGTILNDDGTASNATLRIADVSKAEGNAGTSNANFVVTLSPASTGTVTVKYATANGTARTGNRDYTATSGKLTFTPGQIRKTVAVKVIGDTVKEADETFVVNLSAPTGATLADSQGIGTILNDD